VVAFRQSDGGVVWKSGDFLTSDAPPILIRFEGEEQLVIFAGAAISRYEPRHRARALVARPRSRQRLQFQPAALGDDNILFMSSAYKMGSRAIRLKRDGDRTLTEELWYVDRAKFQFLNALRVGDYVYGTSGSLGVAFLMALDVKTGAIKWQQRGFAQSTLLYADGKAIILDEDGDLAMLRLTPDGMTVLAQANVFKTRSWTVPTLVGATLYARDREKIAAFDLAAR
jgi:outer membrane protein assembly factor BamB